MTDNTIVSPRALEIAHRIGAKAMEDASRMTGVTLAQLPRAVDDFWRAQVVNTMRGLGLDAGSLWVLVKDYGRDYGVDRTMVKNQMGELLQHFDDADPLDRLGAFGQDLRNWGLDRFVDKETGLEKRLGTGFGASELDKHLTLSSPQRMAAGAALSMVNLRDWVVPVLGPATAAIKGHYAPYLDSAYRTLNNFQHAAPRIAFWKQALASDLPRAADDFAQELLPTGIDITALTQRGTPVSRGDLESYLQAAYVRMSPQDIAKVGAAYDGALEVAAMKSADRIAHIFGDFREGKTGAWKQFISRIFPFSRYAMEYAPVLLESAKRHPLIAAGAVAGTAASAYAATQNGEPPWQGGTVPVTTETPGLGGLARLRLGGQSGTVRLDPLGQFMGPISGQTFAGLGDTENAKPFDIATKATEMGGLSPHPLIKMLAGALGASDAPNGPMDRQVNITNATDLIPGMPTVPTLQGPYNAAKEKITGEPVYDFDTTARHYGELVLAETGMPLDNARNHQYLVSMGDTDEPLWRQAKQEVLMQQLVGGLLSNLTPLTSSAQSSGNAAYQRARADIPEVTTPMYTPGQDRLLEQLRQVAYNEDHPELRTYRNTSTRARDRVLHRGIEQYTPAAQKILKEQLRTQYTRKDR
jgi:hypothetical protein